MFVRIAEVEGNPVKSRISLGGAGNYIEAGQTRGDLPDEVANQFIRNGLCVEVSEEDAKSELLDAEVERAKAAEVLAQAQLDAAIAVEEAAASRLILKPKDPEPSEPAPVRAKAKDKAK